MSAPAGFDGDVRWVLKRFVETIDDYPDIDVAINDVLTQIRGLAGFA